MAIFTATASLAAISGETADVNVNMFAALASSTPDDTTCAAWAVLIKDFYDDVFAAGGMRGRAQTGHTVKFNAQDTSVPNYPFFETTFNLGTSPGNIDLPLEVNLCVSYANDTDNSVARARRRGRIYLSGWTETVNATGRPTSGAYEGLCTAFTTYVDALNSLGGLTACVWSRSNNAGYPLERIWTDNEWDTMRSRGGKATLRETQSVA